jgi:iron complex transport system ATP-binding protein
MLKIDNHTNTILKNITLNIKDQNLIILGDNGAGKTTLAKTLCGLIKSDDIFLNDQNINGIRYNKRVKLLNYIPPKLEIFDDYINVTEYLKLGIDISESKIDTILEKLGIAHLKLSSCKFLSSGESQLLLIASGILHNALFSIFDEPTSNLDPKKIQTVFSILQSNQFLQNKIIITHNLNLAYKLGFDIVFIQDGKVEFQGENSKFFTEENLKKFYQNSVKKLDDNIVVNV